MDKPKKQFKKYGESYRLRELASKQLSEINEQTKVPKIDIVSAAIDMYFNSIPTLVKR